MSSFSLNNLDHEITAVSLPVDPAFPFPSCRLSQGWFATCSQTLTPSQQCLGAEKNGQKHRWFLVVSKLDHVWLGSLPFSSTKSHGLETSPAEVISAYKLAKKKPVDNYMQRIKAKKCHHFLDRSVRRTNREAKELQLDVTAFNQIMKNCLHLEELPWSNV